MPVGTRIRGNNAQGAVSDNPLGAAATTLNSAGLANLPTVTAGNHAVIILDPLRTAGAPEIVIVTVHTAAATAATVTRGAYGTTARSHAQNVAWVHAPTIDDVVQILTSATRPSDPYRGQLIFETDTNSFVARDAADAWQTAVQLGTWTAYTPTLTQSVAVTKTVVYAAYARFGRTIIGSVKLDVTGAGTAANTVVVGLPVASVLVANGVSGSGYVYDASASAYYGGIVRNVGGGASFTFQPTSTDSPTQLGVSVFTAGLAVGDLVSANFVYEAVS